MYSRALNENMKEAKPAAPDSMALLIFWAVPACIPGCALSDGLIRQWLWG
jgi:hypothetical protein